MYNGNCASHTDNIYQPHLARIVRRLPQIKDHRLFQLRFEDSEIRQNFSYRPGQFVELSIIGTGEAPISISSSPTRPGVIELCVRRIGRMTEALFRLPLNSLVGVRGPYGNGFPLEQMRGNNLLIVAGGLGMAPLRSLLWYALDNRSLFKEVILMFGAKVAEEMLFKYELLTLLDRTDMRCLLTVDKDEEGTWPAQVGVVTKLFDLFEVDPKITYAAVCGPPIMYKFVSKKLLEKKFSKDRILMSLERKMKCGVGKCGHCMIGYKYTCIDGPIFTYWDAINLPEMI
ncbi:oxidoreductase [Candidatus Aerophobetes bacterium]|uniref:Oxidoreductase n=1 Tax=Aerophobetes bacterium TaxID=2030807 RepID=A0A523TH86_UNCAE|nr:MAG: oxidoreductase [Candidatus Aerophobetes bacterium]